MTALPPHLLRIRPRHARRGHALVASFFAGLALIGIVAALWLVDHVSARAAPHDWVEVDCEIVESRVMGTGGGRDGSDSLGPYRLELRYRYEFAGQTHEGTRWRIDDVRPFDVGPVWDAARRHPPGSRATCRVNPAAPHQSVLEVEDVGRLRLLTVVPVAVAVVGIIGVVVTLRRRTLPEDAVPIAPKGSAIGNRGLALVVFAGFLVGGLVPVALFQVAPTVTSWRAQRWPVVDCRIVASGVTRERNPGRAPGQAAPSRTNHFVDVLYEYEVAGVTYRSSRHRTYRFGSLSARPAHDFARAHPSGHATACRVDPRDPRRAVLDPSPPPLLSVPMAFGAIALVGLLGLAATGSVIERDWRRRRPFRTIGMVDRPPWLTDLDAKATPGRSAAPPPPLVTPLMAPGAFRTRAFVWTALALLVNGLVYGLVLPGLPHAWSRGALGAAGLGAAIVLLAPLGALFAYAAIRSIAAARRPRHRIVPSTASPRIGDTIRVDWCRAEGSGDVERVRVELVGVEQRGRHGDRGVVRTEFVAVEAHESVGATTAGAFAIRIPDGKPSAKRGGLEINWFWRVTSVNRRGREAQEEIPMIVLDRLTTD